MRRQSLVACVCSALFLAGCGDRPAKSEAVSASKNAASAENDANLAEAAAETAVPNPVYPIEVSIAGNADLQAAAMEAEKLSNALDAICRELPIDDSLAVLEPSGGGCPRFVEGMVATTEVE